MGANLIWVPAVLSEPAEETSVATSKDEIKGENKKLEARRFSYALHIAPSSSGYHHVEASKKRILLSLLGLVLLLEVADSQCPITARFGRYYSNCTFTSIYDPQKYPVPVRHGSYKNFTLTFTSSYVPHLKSDTFSIPSGYRLLSLTITRSKLSHVDADAMKGFPYLEYLNCSHNNLTKLEKGLYANLSFIVGMDFSYNNISALQGGSFNGHLNFLDLSHNSIEHLRDSLKDLHFVQYLNLSYNRIKSLDEGCLDSAINLLELNLAGNQLSGLGMQLDHLGLLRKLDFSWNNLGHLHVDKLPMLWHLDVGYNALFMIDWRSFQNVPDLKRLNLQGNDLNSTSFLQAEGLPHKLNVSIESNTFTCDQLDDILRHFKTQSVLVEMGTSVEVVNIHGMACNETARSPQPQQAAECTEEVLPISALAMYALLIATILLTTANLVLSLRKSSRSYRTGSGMANNKELLPMIS